MIFLTLMLLVISRIVPYNQGWTAEGDGVIDTFQ